MIPEWFLPLGTAGTHGDAWARVEAVDNGYLVEASRAADASLPLQDLAVSRGEPWEDEDEKKAKLKDIAAGLEAWAGSPAPSVSVAIPQRTRRVFLTLAEALEFIRDFLRQKQRP